MALKHCSGLVQFSVICKILSAFFPWKYLAADSMIRFSKGSEFLGGLPAGASGNLGKTKICTFPEYEICFSFLPNFHICVYSNIINFYYIFTRKSAT